MSVEFDRGWDFEDQEPLGPEQSAAERGGAGTGPPGAIAGVGNGDPTNHEPFGNEAGRHKLFHGLGPVVVKATRHPGRIVLHAAAVGLDAAEIALESRTGPESSCSNRRADGAERRNQSFIVPRLFGAPSLRSVRPTN